MKLCLGFIVLTLVVCMFPLPSTAFEFPPRERSHSGLSLQGYTGILNTPSAHLTCEGSFYGMYSNQKESKWRERTSYQDNFFFSVGFFSIAEIGGKLMHAPGVGATDLSANFKISSAPFFSKYPYLPVLAFGMEDVGGGAKYLQTKYVVASEDLWRFRFSAGYGNGPDRMKGFFGGAELKAHEWVYLLGEYDTSESNLGLRIVTPQFWKVPVSFTATAKTSLTHRPGNIDIAVGFSVPLDFRVQTFSDSEKQDLPKEVFQKSISPNTGSPADKQPSASVPMSARNQLLLSNSDDPGMAKLSTLRDRLVEAGFMNVRVGKEDGKNLVVEYENVTFNHNELDALGVVSGMAADSLKNDYEWIRVVIKKKNIRMLQVLMSLSTVASFMEDEQRLSELKSDISITSRVFDDRDVTYAGGGENSTIFATSFLLWPGLTTMVGTDEGAFDYVLSLKPELYVNLWKGAMAGARWDIPLSWSDNMDDGRPFRDSRTPSRMERLMLFQGIRLIPGLMANLGAGMLVHDLYGTLNELVWQPGDGSHLIRLVQTWGKDEKTHQKKEVYIGSYRYYFAPLDLSLEGRVGRFWAQDKGFVLELKRFFGDTAFSVYYKNTTIREWNSMHFEAAGVEFSFPLTLRRDMKPYFKIQARGTDEWYYGRETVISNSLHDNRNYLTPVPLAVTPRFTGSLHNQFLNRDRLSESYVKSHLPRMRESWLTYRNSL